MDSSAVEFWDARIEEALASGKSVRAAISDMPESWWRERNERVRAEVAKHVQPGESVIELACGLGDLCGLLPKGCPYLGVDFVPKFVEEARKLHPVHTFVLADYRTWRPEEKADWAISIGGIVGDRDVILAVGRKALMLSFPADEVYLYE